MEFESKFSCKTLKGKLLHAIIFVSFAVMLSACGDNKEEKPQSRPIPEVTVATPVVTSITNYNIFTGNTVAVESVDIVARVEGFLESVDFEPSTIVKKGDLLFQIEDGKYKALLENAHAAVHSAEASLKLAKVEVRRKTQAAKSNAVSKLDVEKSESDRDVAKANLKSAQASFKEAELNLSYTKIKSPINGMVSRNLVDAGNLVGHGGVTVLTTVNKMKPMYVYLSVPESNILNFLDQQPIAKENIENSSDIKSSGDETTQIKSRHKIESEQHQAFVERGNETGFPHAGFIDFINNTVDKSIGTVEVRVQLSNEEQNFFPGLFVRIKIPGETLDNAVLIKEVAVASGLAGKYVFTVDKDNIVKTQPVTLGLPQKDGFIHITAGLDGDETYIVNGLLRAREGLPVTPKTETDSKAEKASTS